MPEYFKIKQDGDPVYNIFLIERGKKVSEGVSYTHSFEQSEEAWCNHMVSMTYTRMGEGGDFELPEDCDLMIETIEHIDLGSMKCRKKASKSFTVFQISGFSHNIERKDFGDDGFMNLQRYKRRCMETLSFEIVKSWPGCTIKDAEEMEALISGIRREIALGKLGI